jgi:hypothetical protein
MAEGGSTAPPSHAPRVYLTRAEPTNTLGCGPMPCEEMASQIRNAAVGELNDDNVAQVAHRYLQTREAFHTEKQIVIGMVAMSLFMGMGLPVLVPAIPSTLRYRKVKRACKQYLIDRLGQADFNKIQALDYRSPGTRFRLADILAPHVRLPPADPAALAEGVEEVEAFQAPVPDPLERELADLMAAAQAWLDAPPGSILTD